MDTYCTTFSNARIYLFARDIGVTRWIQDTIETLQHPIVTIAGLHGVWNRVELVSGTNLQITNRCFLVSFRPLVQNRDGREAVRRYELPPFIDGSCRREPDFETLFPSITSTCRAGSFAPRVVVGDRIAYITVQGYYLSLRVPHWRLVAVLKVIQRFDSHEEAAIWYTQQGLSLPSNCLVKDNPPKNFELTNRNPPVEVKEKMAAEKNFERTVRLWDAAYRSRVARWPVFLATEPLFLDVKNPPELNREDFETTFGGLPGTLNPPEITCSQLDALLQIVARRHPPPASIQLD
jgi:hypothetical protein